MQITATFENYEEMMEFAAKLQKAEMEKGQEKKAEPSIPNEVPVSNQVVPPVGQPAPAGMGNAAPVHGTPTQPLQTSAPSYTLDDLSNAAMTLMDRGMQMQLQQLLVGYGVSSLPELPKEQYGAFATALRGMGAQI